MFSASDMAIHFSTTIGSYDGNTPQEIACINNRLQKLVQLLHQHNLSLGPELQLIYNYSIG